MNNYYPFGLEHKGYNDVTTGNVNSVASKFKYNGKELEEGLGYNMYEYEARHYDASLGRFVTIDPLAEDYSFQSPFAYAMNNPIRFIDKLGMGAEWIENGDGTWTAEAGDSAATLSEDAKISYDEANKIVQEQHGKNYVDTDGVEKSAIDPGDSVRVSEQGETNDVAEKSDKKSNSMHPLTEQDVSMLDMDENNIIDSVVLDKDTIVVDNVRGDESLLDKGIEKGIQKGVEKGIEYSVRTIVKKGLGSFMSTTPINNGYEKQILERRNLNLPRDATQREVDSVKALRKALNLEIE